MKSTKIAQSKKFMEKGQALTELAIFGSILLFCVAMLVQYGLQSNYQQQVQMEAFRKTQKMAFYKSGPNAATSLVLVKDKAFPDPRDQFGFTERNPVAAGESVVWDTNQSAQYVKKFTEQPKKEDLPAVYFEIEKGNLTNVNNAISASERPSLPSEAGQNNAFGFYTARFEKRPCPSEIRVVFEDRQHTQGTEYVEEIVRKEDIWVAKMEGGFGETQADPKSDLLMSLYFWRNGSPIKQRITDADVDYDGQLEYVIGADKDKNLLYIDYHGPEKNPNEPDFPYPTLAGAIQIDTAYVQVEPGDRAKFWDGTKWVPGEYLKPEYRQGMITDSEKTVQHTENKIVKTEKAGTITSQTSLNANQTIYHKFRLNNGQVVNIPVEFTVNQNNLYNWGKK